jgi:hypothetical protein
MKRVMKSRERQKTVIINESKGERMFNNPRRSVDCGLGKNFEGTFDLMQNKNMTQT